MLTSTLPRWADDATPRFVLDLAADLAALGWRIEALAPGHASARRSEDMEGVAVRRFAYMAPARLQTLAYGGGMLPNLKADPVKLALVPGFIAAAVAAARRRIATLRPRIVHAHWIVPMGLVAALAVPRSTPIVVSVHGSDALALRGSLLDRVKARILARAAAITCNGTRTEAAVTRLVGRDTPVLRIPMGAARAGGETTHGIALPRDRFLVLFAGRLFAAKGPDDAVEALTRFAPAERPFLLIAGDGPDAQRLRTRAEALGLGPDVLFLGGVQHSRLLALMQDVHAVVAPTRTTDLIEAQGLVVAEAMFAGTPVIATAGGGAEDHVTDGANGLIIPPADPAALAGALARLKSNPALARAIGTAGAAYAEGALSRDATARAFDRLYRRVCAPSR